MSRQPTSQSQRGGQRSNVPSRAQSQGRGAIDRRTYIPPDGYDTEAMKQFRAYLKETGVEETFRKLVKMLLNRPTLPYNPYPGFVLRFRQFAEKFHMEQESIGKIQQTLRNALQETYLPNLFCVRGHDTVWGLSSILRAVDPSSLEKYKWLMEDLTPHPEDIMSTQDYSNQVMLALVGPAVFDGTFYPCVHSVQIRMEHLITGPDVKEGVAVFVNSVMANIDAMYSNPRHLLMGVNIPDIDEEYPDITVYDLWDPDKIQEEKEEFLQVLSDTVIGNKYICMECILRADPYYPKYIRGQIQFGLNFIEISKDNIEEGIVSFCEFPMACLHEGVFLNRSHAEQYISIFSPQVDPFQNDGPRSAMGQPDRPDKLEIGGPRSYSRQSRNRLPTRAQDQDIRTIKRHVYDRTTHIMPRKVRIDGFRIGDENSYGPYAWQITTPIKSHFQKREAGHHMHAELCDAIYCTIILLLLDRDSYAQELPFELYRLLHSTVGQMYLLMEQNKSVRYMVKGFSNTNQLDVIRENMALYREAVIHLFQSTLNDRSLEQKTAGKVIVAQVEDFLPREGFTFESVLDVQLALKTLKDINWYCLTLLIQLAEDSLSQTPILKEIMIAMKNTFPKVIPQPLTRHRERRDPTGVEMDPNVSHGLEHEHMKDLLHEKLIVNVDECIENGEHSKAIAKEAVLIQYMLDTHLDDVWKEYLLELARAQYYPPNPYPRFVSLLRQQAMKMDLFFEKPEQIENLLLATQMEISDPENYIYSVNGVDAYGTTSALRVLDTVAFLPLGQIIQLFVQQNYIQRKGAYRAGICLALSGPSILYGKMQPFLNEVELHEHYYIQGPPGCSGDAIQLFALMVYNHINDMVMKNTIPVVGVFFGEEKWSWEEVLVRKQAFMDMLVGATTRSEPVFLKAFILMDNWRYTPVRKYFLLHFITDDELDGEIFYPDNPVAFYQSVFLSRDRAAFHYQNGGPSNGGDPMNTTNIRNAQQFLDKMISVSKDRCDWMTVHRGLLLKSLMNQDRVHLVESWRMLHSMAGQVEYLISMIDALQDLLVITMEAHEYISKNRSRDATANSQGQSRGKRRTPSKPLPYGVIPDFECTVDEAIFGRMTMVFHKKLVEVTQARIFMTGTPLTEFLKAKLKTCIEEDPRLDNFYFAFNTETLFRLEEVKHMMRFVQDSLAADVHHISPNAMSVVENLAPDEILQGRPSSVVSYMLNDPYLYRPRPQAQMMQTILE
ncbi:uncharacterized protein LOC133205901 isoform X2 [Saccostrea echinata]|uniref:uncharacterized protein LOC133205901 isoform X2 n=2 Tax=Saccostrea echinata TaxID=191078 RepID=UPI002A81457C|nr:uncharacterized protein LOC133205901 isoform X2 [Saccostrea echinata]